VGKAELDTTLEARIEHLEGLSGKAEAGDKKARAELRRVVAECSPAIIAEASNVARRAEVMLTKTIAAGEPLLAETLEMRLSHMRDEIAGEHPTPLERLLSERVVAGWLLVEVLEALVSAQFSRVNSNHRVGPAYIMQMSKILESATRRHLAAIKTLAQVRKLQANTPAAVFNTQVNIGGGGGHPRNC
jgi:hypothetical protein